MAYDIEQLLVNEANRIGPDIYRKTLNTSPWLKLVKKDVWPDEMGDSIRVLTYERSLPSNSLSWSTVSLDPLTGKKLNADGTTGSATLNSDGSYTTSNGNNAVPSAQVIQFAQTLRSYNLTQTALESPKLSVNDLRFSLKRKEQLSNIFAILQENTSYAWQDRYRDEFVRLAQTKINAAVDSNGNLIQGTGESAYFLAAATMAASSTTTVASSNLPTSILVQGLLDRVYMKLIRDGAGNNPLDRENARPVFGAILSSEASRNLIAQNPDIRQDYRWSSKVNELLAPLGIERSYAGFFHMVDDWGPRYDSLFITAVSSGSKTITVTIGGSGNAVNVGDKVNFASGGTLTVTTAGTVTTGSQTLTFAVDPTGTGYAAAAPVSGGAAQYAWVRRQPYASVATTQGVKFDISTAYEQAQYEDTIIFHQDVFANLVPKPITAAGSNVTFDAVSYMGDFKWKNIITPDTNPDGTIGYFRAILSSGSKPIRPEWGYVIRHLRASTPLVLNAVYHGSAEVIAQPTMAYTTDGSGYQPGVVA